MKRGIDLLILVPVPSKFEVDHVITFVLESYSWPTANGSMSPRIWFPNVDYLKLWEKGETRLNSILIIIIRGNRNIKVIFMEEHILIRPDRSLLLLNGLYGMWSSWNNSMIFFHYFSLFFIIFLLTLPTPVFPRSKILKRKNAFKFKAIK